MKWSSAFLAASCGLVAAHGDLPIPRLVGGRKFLSELKARREGPVLPRAQHDQHAHVETRADYEKRQSNRDGRCGPGYESCAAGYCCSEAGCVPLPRNDNPSPQTLQNLPPRFLTQQQMVRHD